MGVLQVSYEGFLYHCTSWNYDFIAKRSPENEPAAGDLTPTRIRDHLWRVSEQQGTPTSASVHPGTKPKTTTLTLVVEDVEPTFMNLTRLLLELATGRRPPKPAATAPRRRIRDAG